MKIPPVKGTRDFYPSQMAVRNFIIDRWKAVSLRNGFEEYDGPIFEYLKMFQIKSGDEIVEQLFSLTDRGGRELAIRPEITPTLARMVNQRINSLPRPIKWFSVPRLCRAERPQKGRLREFFQWNIDIIGVDDVLADAEVIFTTLDYLRGIGLTADDIVVRISSRKLLAQFLMQIGVAEQQLDSLYTLLDKKTRMPAETFAAALRERLSDEQAVRIERFMQLDDIGDLAEVIEQTDELRLAADELTKLNHYLELMGVRQYCRFDPSIVRGLAYYTGIVFEVHDTAGELRAVCGGGRYDNLLSDFGGPKIPATGMGMGDCVLEVLLREKGLLDDNVSSTCLDYFVASVPNIRFENEQAGTAEEVAVRIATKLRTLGFKADFSYRSVGLAKQLKQASERHAKECIIVGEEFRQGKVAVKDMSTGRQQLLDLDAFLADRQSSRE